MTTRNRLYSDNEWLGEFLSASYSVLIKETHNESESAKAVWANIELHYKIFDTHLLTHWPSVSPSRGLGFRQRYSRHTINRSTVHTDRRRRVESASPPSGGLDSTSVQRDSSGDSCADWRVNLVSGDTIKHIPLITGQVCCRQVSPSGGLDFSSAQFIW